MSGSNHVQMLEGEVVLRDVVAADLPIFYTQQLDPQATEMAAFPSRPEALFMKHWAVIMEDRTNTLKTIVYNGEVAGYIVSWNQDQRREVGYWLGREHWSKGIATRALRLLLECFSTRPLHAHVAKTNIASRRVLEKCGFRIISADRSLGGIHGEPVEEFVLRLD